MQTGPLQHLLPIGARTHPYPAPTCSLAISALFRLVVSLITAPAPARTAMPPLPVLLRLGPDLAEATATACRLPLLPPVVAAESANAPEYEAEPPDLPMEPEDPEDACRMCPTGGG